MNVGESQQFAVYFVYDHKTVSFIYTTLLAKILLIGHKSGTKAEIANYDLL